MIAGKLSNSDPASNVVNRSVNNRMWDIIEVVSK